MLTVADCIAGASQGRLSAQRLPAALGMRIATVAVDSREVVEGSLFVALRGERLDGHDFVLDAFGRGAVAAIVERPPAQLGSCTIAANGIVATMTEEVLPVCIVAPDSLRALQELAGYWRREHQVRVTGVTGSVGKTTAKELIAAVLGRRYRTLKSEGNYNNEIGVPLTLLRLESGHERAVLEMGMYALGEIARLCEIAQPLTGVVTNIGPTHLERLGTIERIAEAKAELVRALPPARDGGVAILNIDDERVRAMASDTRARVYTYGLSPEADVWADEIESRGLEGIHISFHSGRETLRVHLPILGRHGVYGALAATAVGLVEGLSWDEIVSGLSDSAVQLRLVAVPGPRGSTILDDSYNASPASSLAALNLLQELKGRKILVHGEMLELGSYEQEGHRMVGGRARDVADILIAVGRRARVIAQEALEAGMPTGSVFMVDTNAQAIELLQGLIEPADILLIKGSRGIKMEEIVSSLAGTATPAPMCKEP